MHFCVCGRHTEDERQTLGYLKLKIWTIFISKQITGNDAHADVYIPACKGLSYIPKRELFYLLLLGGSPEPQFGSTVRSSRFFVREQLINHHIDMRTTLTTLIIILASFLWGNAQTYTLEDKWVDCGNKAQLLDPYYSPGVTFTWDGPVKDGKANGYGVATKYMNGKFESKYEGYYKNGIREGKGTFTHMDGSVKTGNFVNGQLNGKGSCKDQDGNTYEGDFLNYRMHGNGTLTLGNGTTFVGFMVSDAPYTGKLTYYTGDVVYLQGGEPVNRINEKKSGYSPKIGQQVREYFDENWNRCEPKQAAYYRLITYSAPNKPKGIVKDYYISGELQSDQYPIFIDYDDEGKTFLEGKQTFYHKNGKVAKVTYFNNNKPNGPVTEYYPDGAIASESFFNMGVPDGDMIRYYPDGKYATVAKYENGYLHNNKYLQITEDQMVFLVYNEDFDRNREAWEFKGQPGIVQVNDAETITMQANPERTISGGIYTGFAPMSDNIISVVTNQRNPGQGIVTLLFGFKDWDNLCAFSIAGDSYSFTYKKNGVVVQSDDWKKSTAITPDVNTLTVVNNGDKIIMLVNDTPLVETGRIYYDGSFLGVSLYNASEQPIVMDAAQLAVQEVVDPRNIAQEYLPDEKTDPDAWKGNGSGFFLNPNGYIATNYHVVDGTTALQANFTRNGKTESYPATVVVTDPQNDLAIIKIDDKSFKGDGNLPYGLMTRTKDTGSEVFAMGYPMADVMGSEVKFTDGKISSKSGIGGDVRVYQISVPIQPGNSGGPLFDMGGNVVGITSSGLNREYFKSENVNYAIKASYLKNLMEACPEEIVLEEKVEVPNTSSSLTDRIKQYEGYVVLILTK